MPATTHTMPQPQSDADLVRRYLAATADMSVRQRVQATGVSYTTHLRLASGGWDRITGDTRQKIRDYLARREPTARVSDGERRELVRLVGELRDIVARMAEVLEG